MPTGMRILEHFQTLEEPRMIGKTRHSLIDIIAITICAVICGANDWSAVAAYGHAKEAWLRNFLKLPHGIPSHDTFGRVFAMLDPNALEQCFIHWVNSVFNQTGGKVINIDGKTLRRSYDRASKKAAIHMVSAWACAQGLSLGQVKTAAKSNEITAIPELLKLLALEGCLVTIDAMGCQKEIANAIIAQKADYLLALKGNQGQFSQAVNLFFDEQRRNDFQGAAVDFYETVEKDHGRIELRRYWVVDELDWLQGKEHWRELKMIGMVEAERWIGDQVTLEKRCYITSRRTDARVFSEAVRGHWSIENSLHWSLDVTFREDDSRIRQGYSAENFSRLRRLALSLLKHEKTEKKGLGIKRLQAGWDNDYLLKILLT